MNTSELLSALLALFAIGVAVAFALRIEHLSETYSRHTSDLAKQVTDSLLKIEFGALTKVEDLRVEQAAIRRDLQVIREGLARLTQASESTTRVGEPSPSQIADDRDDIVMRFARQSGVPFDEMDEIVADLAARESRYELEVRRLGDIRAAAALARAGGTDVRDPSVANPSSRLVAVFTDLLIPRLGGAEEVASMSPALLESKTAAALGVLPPDAVDLATSEHWLDEDGNLTTWGIVFLRQVAESAMNAGDGGT